jgi:hypothetical protein
MIYRAMATPFNGASLVHPTPRPPGNVPYLLDNIWEWLRPEGYPSRRFSAFASPDPQQAILSAGGPPAQAWSIELLDGQRAGQIVGGDDRCDARHHKDWGELKRLILKPLAAWIGSEAAGASPEAALFLPCATKAQVQNAFDSSRLLNADVLREIVEKLTFWRDVALFGPTDEPPDHIGEIFFEGQYRLVDMIPTEPVVLPKCVPPSA